VYLKGVGAEAKPVYDELGCGSGTDCIGSHARGQGRCLLFSCCFMTSQIYWILL